MPATATSSFETPTPPVRSRAVTLKDVAARAGVGPMSVSAVLNDTQTSTRVSEATRQRILVAAEELGYRRNASAAAARSGRFGSMALVMSTAGHSYFNLGLFIGIEDELSRHDLLLSIIRLADEQLSDSKFIPQILKKLSCDGLLVDYNVDVPPRLMEMTEKFKIPVVLLHIEKPYDSVYLDDEGAAFDATKHLLELGHRRIVHFTYFSSDIQHDSVPNRRRGYELAMKSAGLTPWVEHINPYLKPDTTMERMDAWFKSAHPPTAMLAYGVDCALPAWLAAERLGMGVPEKFSLIATHHEGVRVLGKQLTCWEIPTQDMGREGVRMLLQKIENPSQPIQSKKLPFYVELGETCGPLSPNP